MRRPLVAIVVGSFGLIGLPVGLWGAIMPCEELGCVARFFAAVVAGWSVVAIGSFARHPAGLAAVSLAGVTASTLAVALALNGVIPALLVPAVLAALVARDRGATLDFYLRREGAVR